ncbi:MAG TPA: hypothetical protein VEL11_07465, partial [Candidatus Bathyarchaeia archaeon]|nr:hypothetical protein [Candidatus Bathyarchaeia archaeon]
SIRRLGLAPRLGLARRLGLAPTLVGLARRLGLAPTLVGLAPRLVGTPLVGLTTDRAKNGLNVYSIYFFIFYYLLCNNSYRNRKHLTRDNLV